MAVEGRINVRHEDVFTQPVLLLSVDPVEDFDKKRGGQLGYSMLSTSTPWGLMTHRSRCRLARRLSTHS